MQSIMLFGTIALAWACFSRYVISSRSAEHGRHKCALTPENLWTLQNWIANCVQCGYSRIDKCSLIRKLCRLILLWSIFADVDFPPVRSMYREKSTKLAVAYCCCIQCIFYSFSRLPRSLKFMQFFFFAASLRSLCSILVTEQID